MGLIYKAFQTMAYEGLEWSREKGIKVDKQRYKEHRNKIYEEFDSMTNMKQYNQYWELLLQQCDEWGNKYVK